MDFAADPRVDAYFQALPQWQQDICNEVRRLVHGADPGVAGTIRRTVAYRQGGQVNAAALTAMVRQGIAHTRAGGWRRVKEFW